MGRPKKEKAPEASKTPETPETGATGVAAEGPGPAEEKENTGQDTGQDTSQNADQDTGQNADQKDQEETQEETQNTGENPPGATNEKTPANTLETSGANAGKAHSNQFDEDGLKIAFNSRMNTATILKGDTAPEGSEIIGALPATIANASNYRDISYQHVHQFLARKGVDKAETVIVRREADTELPEDAPPVADIPSQEEMAKARKAEKAAENEDENEDEE